MNKKIDFSFVSLKNLKNYLYLIKKGNNEIEYFIIKLNELEIKIPIEIAICYSTKVLELLNKDSTIREYQVNVDFHNQNIINEIIEVLTDENQTNCEIEFQNENDLFDFILFCKAIGYEQYLNYFDNFLSKYSQNLTIKNCLKVFSYCNSIGHFENVDKIISFISAHFYDLIKEEEFYLWCCDDKNFEYLESVLSNELLQINDENELLKFIIKLCGENHIFELLFCYVYLEYCDISTIKLFINYINTQKLEFQEMSMKSILQCLCRRLYQEKLPISVAKQQKRYTHHDISSYITITSNTGEIIPNKYYQQINEKTFKFLYPSEDSTKCSSIFKLLMKAGKYKLECIGASGGKGIFKEGGCGGYSSGVLSLSEDSSLFLFIGGQGSSISGQSKAYVPGGFNGGGRGQTGDGELAAGSGGGCTDIRLNSENLKDRIIVAGGGGGSAGFDSDGHDSKGGDGGGIIGSDGTGCYSNRDENKYGTGGSQEKPGICAHNGEGKNGENNVGGDGKGSGSSGGGGGGGYYGGGGGYYAAGGGGSGYVSDKLESGYGINKETKEFANVGTGYIIISHIL